MRAAQLATRVRHADLAVVDVAGEDEVEGSGGQAVDDVGVVRQQDAQLAAGVGEPRHPTVAAGDQRRRVHPGDLHVTVAQAHHAGLVVEQRCARQARHRSAARERVAGAGDVVVAEHRVAGWQTGDQLAQARLTPRVRQQVARDQRQVGLLGDRPRHRLLDGAAATRRHPEVEIREVRDAQAVQLGRQPRQLEAHHPDAQPACFEPAPEERCRSGCQHGDDNDPGHAGMLLGKRHGAGRRRWRRPETGAARQSRAASTAAVEPEWLRCRASR